MCQIERVEDKTHALLAKQFWKRVRSKCRNAVAKRRRQQREEEKRNEPCDVANDPQQGECDDKEAGRDVGAQQVARDARRKQWGH